MKPKAPFIPALTGIRFVAALLVFLHHSPLPFDSGPLGVALVRLEREGYIGIEIFFVLSGFLITYRNFDGFQLKVRWLFVYLRNRLARIFPLYLFILFLSLLRLGRRGVSIHPLVLLVNVTLVKGFFNGFKFTGLPQAWTLTVEECFYLVAPLVFLAARRRKLALPFLALAAVGLELTRRHPLFPTMPFFDTFLENYPFCLTYTFFGHLFSFFVGTALALFVLKMGPRTHRRPLFTYLGVVQMGLLIFALTRISADPDVAIAVRMPGHNVGWFHYTGIVIVSYLFPMAAALFYFGLIVEPSRLRSFLASSPLVLLGHGSYAFYLVQQGVFHQFFATVTQSWLLTFGLLVVLSLLLYRFVEKPAYRLLTDQKGSIDFWYQKVPGH